MIDPLEVRLVNCARCDEVLLGLSMRGHALPWTCDGLQFMADRINQRPYCKPCLERMRGVGRHEVPMYHYSEAAAGGAHRRSRWGEEASAWQENAIRVLEGE